jgi:hypothetical protein
MLYLPWFSFQQRMWQKYIVRVVGFKRLVGRSADPTFLEAQAKFDLRKKMQKLLGSSEKDKKTDLLLLRYGLCCCCHSLVSWIPVRMHTPLPSSPAKFHGKIFRAESPTFSMLTLSTRLPACLPDCLSAYRSMPPPPLRPRTHQCSVTNRQLEQKRSSILPKHTLYMNFWIK